MRTLTTANRNLPRVTHLETIEGLACPNGVHALQAGAQSLSPSMTWVLEHLSLRADTLSLPSSTELEWE